MTLKTIPGNLGSDYINASFVSVSLKLLFENVQENCETVLLFQGYAGNEYIAAQGLNNYFSSIIIFQREYQQLHSMRQLIISGGWCGSMRLKLLSC